MRQSHARVTAWFLTIRTTLHICYKNILLFVTKTGAATGTRTLIPRLKIWCPSQLDDSSIKLVHGEGIEPPAYRLSTGRSTSELPVDIKKIKWSAPTDLHRELHRHKMACCYYTKTLFVVLSMVRIVHLALLSFVKFSPE